MKIILQKPVDKLGVPGDVVDVADGYARNYLMPRGLAVKATKGGVKHVDSLKRAHSTRVDAAKADAEQVAQRLMASPITVPAHAGEEGRLFGSVTPSDVAAAIEAQTGVRSTGTTSRWTSRSARSACTRSRCTCSPRSIR